MFETLARELIAPKFLVLYAYAGTVLFLHFRGRERLKFGRQFLDHSGLFAPYNFLMYVFSAVPGRPLLDPRAFPDLAPLRDNWTVIRDEARALLDGGHVRGSDAHNDMVFLSFYKRGWKRFYLKWYGDFLPSATQLCPKTIELVRGIPNLNAVAFTLLPPGCRLGRHRDPCAGSLRYHLGLITPNSEECCIWVDGDKHVWRDGEDVVFDETYVHWAKNDTDETRLILFCDVTRPLRTPVVRALNRFMIRFVWRIFRSQNVPDERVGVANWFTRHIYRYKYFLKDLKSANRIGYYAGKWVLIGGAAVLILGYWL